MPWTNGKVIFEDEPALGKRFALAEKACKESVVKMVEFPSSAAEMMMD